MSARHAFTGNYALIDCIALTWSGWRLIQLGRRLRRAT